MRVAPPTAARIGRWWSGPVPNGPNEIDEVSPAPSDVVPVGAGSSVPTALVTTRPEVDTRRWAGLPSR